MVRTIRFSHGASWHVREPVHVEQFEWQDLSADPLQRISGSIDIIFLLDTSGSMGGEIRALKQSCVAFADRILEKEKNLNARLGLVGFAIGGHSYSAPVNYAVHDLSRYTIGVWPLASPGAFRENIQSLTLRRLGGTGCYLADEDTVDIFPEILRVFDGPAENKRILVVISDEIGGTEGLDKIVSLLEQSEVTTHVLGVPGALRAHEELARRTGGQFWDILATKGQLDFDISLFDVADTIAHEITKRLRDGRESKGTDMGHALKLVAGELEIPPMTNRAFPPVLALMSDGVPTDNFEEGLQRLMGVPWGRRAIRVAIAIGREAQLEPLQQFIGSRDMPPLRANNPEALAERIRFVSTAVLKEASAPAGRNVDQRAFDQIQAQVQAAMDVHPAEDDVW